MKVTVNRIPIFNAIVKRSVIIVNNKTTQSNPSDVFGIGNVIRTAADENECRAWFLRSDGFDYPNLHFRKV